MNHFLFASLLLLCITLFSGCQSQKCELPAPPEWITQEQRAPQRLLGSAVVSGKFKMDKKKSVVHWVGKKKWPYTEYQGILQLANGEIDVNANRISSGDFIIDMNTLDIVSLKNSPSQYKKMLDRMRNNFFYVNEYPTIGFKIISVNELEKKQPNGTHQIKGRLTIKEATNDITIPAVITLQNNEIKAYSRFSINRNDYNIIYKENSVIGGIGNAAIMDSIDMALELIGMIDNLDKSNL